MESNCRRDNNGVIIQAQFTRAAPPSTYEANDRLRLPSRRGKGFKGRGRKGEATEAMGHNSASR